MDNNIICLEGESSWAIYHGALWHTSEEVKTSLAIVWLSYKDHFQEHGVDVFFSPILIWNTTKNPGHYCGVSPEIKIQYYLPQHQKPGGPQGDERKQRAK